MDADHGRALGRVAGITDRAGALWHDSGTWTLHGWNHNPWWRTTVSWWPDGQT